MFLCAWNSHLHVFYMLETSIITFEMCWKLPSPRLQCAWNFHLHVFYQLETSISTFAMCWKLQSPRLLWAWNFNLHVCYELETSISPSTHFLFFHRIARIFNPFFYMFRINSLYVCLLFRIKYFKKTFSTVVRIFYFRLFYLVKCTCGRIF